METLFEKCDFISEYSNQNTNQSQSGQGRGQQNQNRGQGYYTRHYRGRRY